MFVLALKPNVALSSYSSFPPMKFFHKRQIKSPTFLCRQCYVKLLPVYNLQSPQAPSPPIDVIILTCTSLLHVTSLPHGLFHKCFSKSLGALSVFRLETIRTPKNENPVFFHTETCPKPRKRVPFLFSPLAKASDHILPCLALSSLGCRTFFSLQCS